MPVFEWKAPRGLNLAVSGMAVPEVDAIRLVNWIPRPGYLEARKGTSQTNLTSAQEPLGRVTGSGAGFPVTLIAEHRNGNVVVGTRGSSASANHTLYVVPAALDWTGNRAVGYTSTSTTEHYNHAHFNNRIIFTRSGLDPVEYDGSTFTALTVSGVTATDLDTAVPFKGRMYYTAEGNKAISGNFYYAAAGAYQGALTAFPAGENLLRGGSIFLLVPLSIDGGDGPDDLLCAISDRGECLVYSGDDPASATDWSLVGRFDIGRPLGRQCWAKVGSTTIIVTEHGPMDLQAVFSTGAGAANAAVNAMIDKGVLLSWDDRQTDYDASLVLDANERVLWWFSRRRHNQNLSAPVAGSIAFVSAMDLTTKQWTQIHGFGQFEFNIGPEGPNDLNPDVLGPGGTSAAIVNGSLVLGSSLGRLHVYGAVQDTSSVNPLDSVCKGVDAPGTTNNKHISYEFLTGYSTFERPGAFKQPTSWRAIVEEIDRSSTAFTPLDTTGFVYFWPDWGDVQRNATILPPITGPTWPLFGYGRRLNFSPALGPQGRRIAAQVRLWNCAGWRWHGMDVDFTVTAETSGKR